MQNKVDVKHELLKIGKRKNRTEPASWLTYNVHKECHIALANVCADSQAMRNAELASETALVINSGIKHYAMLHSDTASACIQLHDLHCQLSV